MTAVKVSVNFDDCNCTAERDVYGFWAAWAVDSAMLADVGNITLCDVSKDNGCRQCEYLDGDMCPHITVSAEDGTDSKCKARFVKENNSFTAVTSGEHVYVAFWLGDAKCPFSEGAAPTSEYIFNTKDGFLEDSKGSDTDRATVDRLNPTFLGVTNDGTTQLMTVNMISQYMNCDSFGPCCRPVQMPVCETCATCEVCPAEEDLSFIQNYGLWLGLGIAGFIFFVMLILMFIM